MIEGDWKERVGSRESLREGRGGRDRERWRRGLKVARGKGGWENGDGRGPSCRDARGNLVLLTARGNGRRFRAVVT